MESGNEGNGNGNEGNPLWRVVTSAIVSAIAVAVAAVVLAAGVGSGAVFASQPSATVTPAPTAPPGVTAPPQLGLIAVGQTRGYFDITVAPGKSKMLTVKLSNPGAVSVAAQTYRADVFSLLNGGLGSRTGADARSGATDWLDYRGGPVTVGAEKVLDQSFTVTVPAGTLPGEYISSIIAESGAISPEAVAAGANQILRTAVAVSIRVPGELNPAVAIDEVTQEKNITQTTLAVALNNTGNARLKPQVRLAITDSGGNELYVKSVSMDSFYAHTSTKATAILPTLLPAGRYRVSVTVRDPSAKLAPISAVRGFTVPGVVTVHPKKAVPAPTPAASDRFASNILLPVGVGILVLGGLALLIHRRRSRPADLARDSPDEH